MSRIGLEDLIGAIYDAAAEPERWNGVLRDVTQLISGYGAALHVHCTAGSSFAFGADYNADPAALKAHVQHYYKINPMIPALARVPAGAVVLDRSLVPRELLVKSEYYQDYARKFDLGGAVRAVLGRNGPFQSCLTVVHRSGVEPFSEDRLALLRRLTPHLQRAIGLGRRFEVLRAALNTMTGTLDRLETGIMLLDARGAVIYANAMAERLLREREGLYLAGGKLCPGDPAAKDAFDAAVRDAVDATGERGGFVAIRRAEGRRPLSLRVAALPEGHAVAQGQPAARAIVFAADPEAGAGPAGAAAAIVAAYGLTAAEVRVAEALAAGDSVKEAAPKLGIAEVTARNHLNRALAKTGARRQAELVRLLLSSRLPVR